MTSTRLWTAPLWVAVFLVVGLNLILAAHRTAAEPPEGPTGACCLPAVFACIDGVSEVECLFAFSGIYQGDGTTCGGAFCGACCLPDESCGLDVSPDVCAAAGGSFAEQLDCPGISCVVAACCLADASCVAVREVECTSLAGVWNGPDGVCGDFNQNGFDDVCETAGCPHDSNNDGEVGIVDFLDLLASWGRCP